MVKGGRWTKHRSSTVTPAKRAFDAKDTSKAVPAMLVFFLAVLAAAVGMMPIQLALGLTTVTMRRPTSSRCENFMKE